MERYYHLSYDAKDLKTDFPDKDGNGDSDKARNFILCVLQKTLYGRIESCNESSLVIMYLTIQPKLFNYLESNIAAYFWYTISLVALLKNTETIESECNGGLNGNLQDAINALDCLEFVDLISEY
ncbi:MAG TPA: hypothetical protein VK543_02480 [Puia sp.]|nr:hypothetical protein [Puia sp.]